MHKTMRLLVLLLLLGVIGSSQYVHEQYVHVHNGFLIGQEYLDYDARTQQGYAMGVVDGMWLAPMFGAPDGGTKLKSLGACMEGMYNVQIKAIIDKFLKDHPERWNDQMHLVAFTAMTEACSKK